MYIREDFPPIGLHISCPRGITPKGAQEGESFLRYLEEASRTGNEKSDSLTFPPLERLRLLELLWIVAKKIKEREEASNIRQEPQNIDGPPMSDRDITGIIKEAAATYNVDEKLIFAVIKVESDFKIDATSPAGAQGLMQLMPQTARELGVKNPFDPRENILAGTRYLKALLQRYGGDLNLALAAYNWGMGNVEKNPGKMPQETMDYITRVRRYYASAEV